MRWPTTRATSCARWRCPKAAEPWSLTSLREKLIKIGAKVTSHARFITFQIAEVTVSRQMFADILSLIAPAAGIARAGMSGQRSSAANNNGRRGTPRCRPVGACPRSSAVDHRF
jgi:hypothetical protein